MTELYAKDAKGKIRVWTILGDGNIIYIQHGTLGGAQTEQVEVVEEGKQSRTLSDQVEHRIQSRISKMIDKGYCHKIEDAKKEQRSNAMGLVRPMLASPIKSVKAIDWNSAFIQRKYDGHRCLITKQDGELIAYSRNGKPITSISHILKNIYIQEGQTMDGELYLHETPLQTLTSWIKKEQKETQQLRYLAYDMIDAAPFPHRLELLEQLARDSGFSVFVAGTRRVHSKEDALDIMMEHKQDGYEGAIVRHGDLPYEDSKRSKSVVKFKQSFDSNFIISNVITSKEGWGILCCLTPQGKMFKVSAPGTIEEKRMAAYDPSAYIGRVVRVEFANLTLDEIPFHPVATNYPDEI